MQPYKYAGYPQLIKTIQIETADDQLFSKSDPLLAAASELAYHTVHCSALNAEELRRENGLEVKNIVFTRVFVMIYLLFWNRLGPTASVYALRECFEQLFQAERDLRPSLHAYHEMLQRSGPISGV